MAAPAPPVRVAVLGAGSWGINHVRVLAAEPRCRIVAVAEPDEGKRRRIAELAPAAQWTASAEAIVRSPEIEAVVIAAPASTHVELALAAFEAGKHVLVEKPLAMCSKETADLIEEAERRKRVLMGR